MPLQPAGSSPGTALAPAIDPRIQASFDRQNFMHTIGARLLRAGGGIAEIEMPVADPILQHTGFVHAGAVTAIADTACGYAAASAMSADRTVLTIEYKINFMAPAIGTALVARAGVKRSGRTTATVAADVFARTERGERLVATMLATMASVPADIAPKPVPPA